MRHEPVTNTMNRDRGLEAGLEESFIGHRSNPSHCEAAPHFILPCMTLCNPGLTQQDELNASASELGLATYMIGSAACCITACILPPKLPVARLALFAAGAISGCASSLPLGLECAGDLTSLSCFK